MPLYIAYHGLMGLKPLEPGFKRFELRPQLGDLEDLGCDGLHRAGPGELAHTQESRANASWYCSCRPGGQGELVLPQDEAVELPEAATPAATGNRRYKLPPGGTLTLRLKR